MREYHAQFCEKLKGWFLQLTHPYIKIKGEGRYLCRAVDTDGKTVDFLLTANRDKKATLGFFKKAMGQHGRLDTETIDKSSANTAALSDLNEDANDKITIRQSKYLNNLVEQDYWINCINCLRLPCIN